MRSSILWEYYDQEEKAEKAKCKTCNKEVSTSGGSTSGLKKHLRVHPKVLEDYMKKQEELEKHRPSVKRPAEDEAEARALKQTKLDFGGNYRNNKVNNIYSHWWISVVSEHSEIWLLPVLPVL